MPVPIRDDGSPGPTRRLVVFVHGFNSNAERCWGQMAGLLRDDAQLACTFEIDTFEYDTDIVRLSLLRRIPCLDEIAAELESYLDRKLIEGDPARESYIDTTLVGHSLGGLVAQKYIVRKLSVGRGRDLDRLRQLILFATPNFGSEMLGSIRNLLSPLVRNPQEDVLRAFGQEVKALHHTMRESVIDARSRGDYKYPLPVYCFWGDADAIVSEASARGHFQHGEPLRGDHSTLKEPTHREHDSYKAFVQALVHPQGHKHIWEIESFSYNVRVKPLRAGTIVTAKHGGKTRLVETDNVAEVVREVRFGRHNRCEDPFPLRYGTRNGGWISPNQPEHSVTSSEKRRLYDDNGTEVIEEIAPAPSRKSSLRMTVYKGFDDGHRDYHMHLGRRAYFRRLHFEVDLSEYLVSGWHIKAGPNLYFHPTDSGDHRLCANREMLDPDPTHEYDPRGIWRWTLEHVKEGVIDIAWDLAPSGPTVSLEAPSVVELGPGEHAVFGYGSLLSRASLERTLGRTYRGPLVICDLIGWARAWNVFMPNSTYVFQDGRGSWISPERLLYLNIVPAPGKRVNGVVFVATDDDLRAFDEREWIYERVVVNDLLRGVTVMRGTAWAFVGRSEFLLAPPSDPRQAAVRRTYVDIVDGAKASLGSAFAAKYESSTEPVPGKLVVDDHKRDEISSGAS